MMDKVMMCIVPELVNQTHVRRKCIYKGVYAFRSFYRICKPLCVILQPQYRPHTHIMSSSPHQLTETTWSLEAVPRQKKNWLSLLSFRFGTVLCSMVGIVCFAWALVQHENNVVYTDGIGAGYSSFNLGTVRSFSISLLQNTHAYDDIVNIWLPLVQPLPPRHLLWLGHTSWRQHCL